MKIVSSNAEECGRFLCDKHDIVCSTCLGIYTHCKSLYTLKSGETCKKEMKFCNISFCIVGISYKEQYCFHNLKSNKV